MSMIATDVKGILTIKFKPRTDHLTDQYSRIFMVKLLLACTVVTGISWYTDKMNCIIPKGLLTKGDLNTFIQNTCWIQGVYVYREISKQFNRAAYYGITKDIDLDGLTADRELCATRSHYGQRNEDCYAMEKTYFQQYQWLPFYLCAMALLCYVPYMLHTSVNYDLIKLAEMMKEETVDTEKLIKRFFKEGKVRRCSLICCLNLQRIVAIFIKLFYIFVNAFAVYASNKLFNNEFYHYGMNWVHWSRSNNHTMQFEFFGIRETPKPGDEFLPPFGYCELYSQSKDIKYSYGDKYKLLCEVSQNVLYQHAFLLLWFAHLVGVAVSAIGLLYLLCTYIIRMCVLCRVNRQNSTVRNLFKTLTYRQIEYLEVMKNNNFVVYSEVLHKLARKRLNNVKLS